MSADIVDRLIAAANHEYGHLEDLLDNACDTIILLRKVLEPFARHAKAQDGWGLSDDAFVEIKVTVGDLRRARAVLMGGRMSP